MAGVFDRKTAWEFLGVSEGTFNRLMRDGKLPHRKIRKRVVFTESDLTTFLDSCAVPATAVLTDREKLEMAKRQGVQNENPS